MAHGISEDWLRGNTSPNVKNSQEKKVKTVREGRSMGSRRIFSPQFKLQVLDSYRHDSDCRGNQRATARKYGIHRRQIQKWLQMESALRCTAEAAVENGETALNLASGRQRDDSSQCSAGSITAPETTQEEEELNVDKISDSEDEQNSVCSLYDQDQALDFTCAALSRKKFFSLTFKLEVIDAYYNDTFSCRNLRAVARKFGVHKRQVQKWLNQEEVLRTEAKTQCLDLSKKRKMEPCDYGDCPPTKRTFIDLDIPEQPSSVQETALCLVKQPSTPPEVSSSVEFCCRPYSLCCIPEPSPYDTTPWSTHYYPYYGGIHTSYVTKWLHQDAHYYKQAVKDINLYTPMYS